MQDDKTPFNIQPLEGYQEFLQTVPTIDNYKSQLLLKSESWFNQFPLCCDKHKDLENESWFNKSDYDNVVAKIVNQCLYSIHCLETSINQKEWYNLITEYLADNLASFGEFENSCYGNCGGDQYHKEIKFIIEQHIIESEKKESLLLFLDYAEYVERINEIRDIIRGIVPTNHEVFYPLIDEYEKKINSLFTLKESKYTNRYNLVMPQISKIEEEIKKFTESILKIYDIEWFYDNGKIQNKNDILNRILFHQNRLSKKGCETIAHKWLKDEMVKWLQSLYTLIESLRIEILPESNFKLSTKSKLNEPPKGFDLLGFSVPQLETLHRKLIENLFLAECEFVHFENAFSNKELPLNFKELEWIDQTQRTHHISIQTVFQLLDSCKIDFRGEYNIIPEVKEKIKLIFNNDFGNIPSKFNDFKPLNTKRHILIDSIINLKP